MAAVMLISTAAGCAPREDISDLTAVAMTVSETPNTHKLDGFGVEWDPHFFRTFNAVNLDEDDWTLVKERAKELGVQKIRVMVLPGWIEPENDNDDPDVTDLSKFNFETDAFKSLLRELDAAEELGIKVNLTIWGAELSSSPWLAYPDCGDWVSAPNDPEEYAENVSVLFKYLLDTKGYTCIKELTIHNEPDWAFKDNNGVVYFEYYAEVCLKTHERFVRDGLRDRIKFNLSDDTMNVGWLQQTVDTLSGIADMYNSHSYMFINSDTNETMTQTALTSNSYIQLFDSEKPYTHNEFGTSAIVDAYHQSNTDDYDRGLLYARFAANFLNSGSCGMLHWVLFDQYYYDGPRENALMQLGLFKYKDEGWEPRPMYYAWGLIMKHTRVDSEIYPISTENGNVCGTALKSPDGKWTFIVASSAAGEDLGMTLENAQLKNETFKKYLYSEDTLTTGDKLPEPVGSVAASNGSLSFAVPDESFVILTNLE